MIARKYFLTRPTLALVSLMAALFLAGCASVETTDPALRDPAKNSAIRPEPREGNWMRRHESFNEIAKRGGVDVLFLGDSITDAWRTPAPRGGKAIWDRDFAPLRAENFGISGDRTQHVLWRLQNGNLAALQPKVAVMMIGTNNTGFERDNTTPRNTTAQTVEGVKELVRYLRAQRPQMKILLLAVFPRGEKPDHPQRKQVNEINAAIAKLHDGRNVRFLDLGQKFLAADGTLPKDIMPDFLHPNEKGYEIWAAALKQPLAEMLR